MFSIIFKNETNLNEKELAFFNDLNLAPVIKEISKANKDVDIKPFYYTMLQSEDEINYRLEVFKDLENESLRIKIASFANRLHYLLGDYNKLANVETPNYVHKATLVDIIRLYLEIANELKEGLETNTYSSLAIKGLYEYICNEISSPLFVKLKEDLATLDEMMSKIEYCVFLNEGYINVAKPENPDTDFSYEVNNKLKRLMDNTEEAKIEIKRKSLSPNIKRGILQILAGIYSEEFDFLNKFYLRYANFISKDMEKFPQEFFFYTSYLQFMEKIKTLGLKFTIPTVSTTNKEVEIFDTYDLALAHSFLYTDRVIIPNDFYLKDKERTIIISGPNQGGKTTFARMFGQLSYLASLGLPVPGTKAKLYAPDQIFTHFEVEESIIKANGKLQQELLRLKEIMDNATSRSTLILNEVFASTSIVDGLTLGKKFLDQVKNRDMICVFVTFLDDLSRYNDTVVSMVSNVIPETPEVRTLKILRKDADGLAYADAIAKKYSLDYKDVLRRLQK